MKKENREKEGGGRGQVKGDRARMAERIWRDSRTGQSTVDNLQTHPARRKFCE